jgi:hypothetical protein
MATNERDIEQRIYERLTSDPAFREELKNDPRSAVEQTLGIRLPSNLTLKIVENTDDTHYILLPNQASGPELSDEDLDNVAGGIITTAPTNP